MKRLLYFFVFVIYTIFPMQVYAYEATCTVNVCLSNISDGNCKGPYQLSLQVSNGILSLSGNLLRYRYFTERFDFWLERNNRFTYLNNDPNRSQFDLAEIRLGKFNNGMFTIVGFDNSEVYIEGLCAIK